MGEVVAGDGRGQLDVLIDDVLAVGDNPLGEEDARGGFARGFFADAAAAAGQTGDCGRAHGTLQVQGYVVAACPQSLPQSCDFMQGSGAKRSLAPFFGWSKMQMISNWLGSASRRFTWDA